MSDKELIKQEIERRYNCEKCYPLDREANVAAAVLQELLLFIDSLPEEPANEDIENELERFAYSLPHSAEGFWPEDIDPKSVDARTKYGVRHAWSYEKVMDIARHFAEWQKQQIMKDAVEGYVSLCHDYPHRRSLVAIEDGLSNFEYAEKIKLIPIKEK